MPHRVATFPSGTIGVRLANAFTLRRIANRTFGRAMRGRHALHALAIGTASRLFHVAAMCVAQTFDTEASRDVAAGFHRLARRVIRAARHAPPFGEIAHLGRVALPIGDTFHAGAAFDVAKRFALGAAGIADAFDAPAARAAEGPRTGAVGIGQTLDARSRDPVAIGHRRRAFGAGNTGLGRLLGAPLVGSIRHEADRSAVAHRAIRPGRARRDHRSGQRDPAPARPFRARTRIS